MYKIEYDIILNEDNRPVIHLPDEYGDNPEDKFMVMEIARYFIQQTIIANQHRLDETTIEMGSVADSFIGQISDEMAKILFDQMLETADVMKELDDRYPIKINSVEELDRTGDYIQDGDRIYKKEVGLLSVINGVQYMFDGEMWIEK